MLIFHRRNGVVGTIDEFHGMNWNPTASTVLSTAPDKFLLERLF